jgi:hypothetical protein
MGLYDSLLVHCKCGNEIELQSEAGYCEMYLYNIEECPLEILIDLEKEEHYCDRCNKGFFIKVQHSAHLLWN